MALKGWIYFATQKEDLQQKALACGVHAVQLRMHVRGGAALVPNSPHVCVDRSATGLHAVRRVALALQKYHAAPRINTNKARPRICIIAALHPCQLHASGNGAARGAHAP